MLLALTFLALSFQEQTCDCNHQVSSLAILEQEMTSLHRKLSPFLLRVILPVETISPEGVSSRSEISVSGLMLSRIGLFVAPTPPSSFTEPARVRGVGGEQLTAELVRTAPELGLSLFRCRKFDYPGPEFAPSKELRPGTVAITLGNSFGMEATFDLGYVAGTNRSVAGCAGLIQLTNTINPGDGGGLVADRQGRVIGVLLTSLREAATREQQRTGRPDMLGLTRSESISFAIPSDRILVEFARELKLPVGMPRLRLGVLVRLGPEQELLVEQVLPAGAAAKAGLRKGDVLTQLGSTNLASLDDIQKAILTSPPTAQLHYLRDGKAFTVTVKLRW